MWGSSTVDRTDRSDLPDRHPSTEGGPDPRPVLGSPQVLGCADRYAAAAAGCQRASAAAPTSGASLPSAVNVDARRGARRGRRRRTWARRLRWSSSRRAASSSGGAERRRHRAGEQHEAQVEHGDGGRHGPADHHAGALDDRRRRPPQRAVGLVLDRRRPTRTPSGSPAPPHDARQAVGLDDDVAELAGVARAGRAAGGRWRSRRPRRRRTRAAPSRRSTSAATPIQRSASTRPCPAGPSTVGSPVSSPIRSRSSKRCHTGRCSGRDRAADRRRSGPRS